MRGSPREVRLVHVLMTVSTTHRPATDLGYLLHKHPERVQSFPVSAGTAHVFYPQAAAARTTGTSGRSRCGSTRWEWRG